MEGRQGWRQGEKTSFGGKWKQISVILTQSVAGASESTSLSSCG